ncbi:MAG: hypothetical protein LBU22_00075, partial [Dysgonamonadaceae bacterium]|nr:hypothetical protein [Dysgonamonadaceae bacterium]
MNVKKSAFDSAKPRIYLFLSVLFIASYTGHAQGQVQAWDNQLTVEQNIVKNALAFQTNDTFPFLDEIAETKS